MEIPSKSLLDSSYKFQQISESFDEHGIKVSKPSYDLNKMMQRKDEISYLAHEDQFNRLAAPPDQGHHDGAGHVRG